MKDPLTMKELETFVNCFCRRFGQNYEKALASGAMSEEDAREGNYNVARSVLMITAKQFEPVTKSGKESLRNLQNFI